MFMKYFYVIVVLVVIQHTIFVANALQSTITQSVDPRTGTVTITKITKSTGGEPIPDMDFNALKMADEISQHMLGGGMFEHRIQTAVSRGSSNYEPIDYAHTNFAPPKFTPPTLAPPNYHHPNYVSNTVVPIPVTLRRIPIFRRTVVNPQYDDFSAIKQPQYGLPPYGSSYPPPSPMFPSVQHNPPLPFPYPSNPASPPSFFPSIRGSSNC